MVPEYGNTVLNTSVSGGRHTFETAPGHICKGMRMTTKRKGKKTIRKSAVSGEKKPTPRARAPVSAPTGLKKTSSTIAPYPPSYPEIPHKAAITHLPFPREIPAMYNETYIRIMPQNARHFFSLWEMAPSAIKKIRKTNPKYSKSPAPMLRVYEVRRAGTPQEERRPFSDFPIEEGVGSRYVSVPEPGRAYQGELGFMTPSGEFVPVCSSGTATLPPGRIQKGEAPPGGTTDTEALLLQSLRGTSPMAFDAGSPPDGSSTGAIDPSPRPTYSSPVKPLLDPAAPDRSAASPS